MLDTIYTRAMRYLDPELAHRLTLYLLDKGMGPRYHTPADSSLKISLWGRTFSNPLGLAAGFNKHATALRGCFDLGVGFIELGGVTPKPQAGNPRPRVWRLPEDKAIINFMGLNSEGLDPFIQRLQHYRNNGGKGLIGVNLAKNTDSPDPIQDFLTGIERTAPFVDFIVINVSCPNTKHFASQQEKSAVGTLLKECRTALDNITLSGKVALLVKLSPDLNDGGLHDMLDAALEAKIDGIVATNTSTQRPATLISRYKAQPKGGLSGIPIKQQSTMIIAKTYHYTKGRLPIIGVGGIASAQDAYDKILAGASLIELYTALVYRGPRLIQDIQSGLPELLHKDGYKSVADAVGQGHNLYITN